MKINAQTPTPIITGPNTSCGQTTIVYSISNFDPALAALYNWTITANYYSSPTPVPIANGNFGASYSMAVSSTQNLLYTYTVVVTLPSGDGEGNVSAIFYTYRCCDSNNGTSLINQNISSVPGAISGTYTGLTFRVAGVLTIDINTIFSSCNIIMEEGSEIVINDNIRCDILVNTFIRGTECKFMWKGIRVGNNSIIKTQNATIQDALYGINFTANASGHLTTGTILDRNYISIYAPARTLGHSVVSMLGTGFSFIDGLTINGNALLRPFLGMYPSGTLPFAGVDILDVNDFGFGATGTNNVCNITGINQGIRAFNSGVNIINTIFTNISDRGVLLSSPNGRARYRPQNISNNLFNNVRSGIFANTVVGSVNNLVNISNNVFNNTGTTYNGNFVANATSKPTAISISNPIGLDSYVSINTNYIYNYCYGIVCNNVVSSINGIANSIDHNTIQFNQNESDLLLNGIANSLIWEGIILNGCTGIKVMENNISRSTLFTGAIPNPSKRLYGMDIKLTAGASISENSLSRLGTCVQYTGQNLGTLNTCNKLYPSFAGFNMNNAALNDQGKNILPQDNQWFNFGNAKQISGMANGTPPIWYYRIGTNFTNINNWAVTAANALPTSNPQAQSPCEVPPSNANFINDSITRDIMNENVDYINYQSQSEQISATQLYELLGYDQATFLNDPALVAYYNSISTANEGLFVEYVRLLQNTNITSAEAVLNSISPNNQYQIDYIDMLTIAHKLLTIDDYELTEADSSILNVVAYKTVFEAGNAAIYARAILNLVLADILIGPQRISSETKSSKIYYQKVEDQYYFYANEDDKILRIEVYNNLGQQLATVQGSMLISKNFPSNVIFKVISNESISVFRGL